MYDKTIPSATDSASPTIVPSVVPAADTLDTRLKSSLATLRGRIDHLSHALEDVDNWRVKREASPAQRALVSDKQVLKISHTIKTAISPITTNKTALLHLSDYCADLSGIKINQFGSERPPVGWRNQYILTLIHKTGERSYFLIKDPELVKTIEELQQLANEMNITEYSLTKGMIQACDQMVAPLFYWGKTEWEHQDTHGLYYDKINDPIIIEQFVKQVLPLQKDYKSEEFLIVMDIGGGKGRLADKLISAATERNIPIHYILVEPSDEQIKIATTLLSKYKGNKRCKIEIIHSTFEQFNPMVKAHCVISSGAVVNMNVVPRKKAIENVEKLSNLLLLNGFLIAAGQTAVLIKSKHLTAVGMKVLSYAVPCPTVKGYEDHPFLQISKERAGFFGHYQRYVCQKMTDSPSEIADKKWKRPFGVNGDLLNKFDKEYLTRKSRIQGLIEQQEIQHTSKLWKWRGYVLLACLVAPFTLFISLAFTIPWLKNRYAQIQAEYNDRTWVKSEFTIDEYEKIRNTRQELKATFTKKVDKKLNKPHKVCIGLDVNGNETSNREDIKKVIMLSDKEQAQRWSPAFLRTATQSSYEETLTRSLTTLTN